MIEESTLLLESIAEESITFEHRIMDLLLLDLDYYRPDLERPLSM